MTDSERIRAIEKLKNLSTNALAKDLKLKAAQTLYDIHKGKHGISKELAEIISAKYLDINKLWLLTGEGEMLKPETVDTAHPIRPSARDSDDRFDRLMNIAEMQSKQIEVQGKQIEMLLNKIERLEKQASADEPRPHEASDRG